MTHEHSLRSIPDDELLRRLAQLLSDSRRVEAQLVAYIGAVDERRLYLREASPSMFSYCTQVLHLSEAEAYLRINVARASREHPLLLTMLQDGRLHLSGIIKLAPHLTRENRAVLLERASYRSKCQIEELLAELFPRPDAPALMRKLPERQVRMPALAPSPDGMAAHKPQLCPDRVEGSRAVAPPLPATVLPLAPGRYKVQFTASAELHDKLERLGALLRSRIPDGDLAAIIEEAVSEKLERLEARRFGKTKAPKTQLWQSDPSRGSRHIAAAVRRVVSERDGRRCRYQNQQGRRCPARSGLEFHHQYPFAFGGERGPKNIVLLCRGHNQLLADHDYGARSVARSPSTPTLPP
jgi:5-methylcytosine-specific restriction endonuclease McrA